MKDLHPLVQILLTLFIVLLLAIFLLSLIVLFVENGDFEEIRANYGLGLKLVMIMSAAAFAYLIYYLAKSTLIKNEAKLVETTPIIHWNYDKYYWKDFKTSEFRKKGFIYVLKILLIWIPIISLLFFIHQSEPAVAIVLSAFIAVCTLPIIPFTVGKFYSELKNQLFHGYFEVKIYKKGLTINQVYYPYNHYDSEDNNLRLVSIEKKNLYSTDCLKFTIRKKFYSPPTHDGGDSGSVIPRKKMILIPLPRNEKIDLHKIRKQLGLR